MPSHQATLTAAPSHNRARDLAARGRRFPAWSLVPALTLWLAFSRGGFFVGETGEAAVVVCAALLLWATLAPDPAAGLRRLGLVAVVALASFTAWTLLSSLWSDSPARTVYEFDRLVLYLGTFLVVALAPGGTDAARWLVRALALALLVVCAAGLLSRLYPDLISSPEPAQREDRLSWPLGYWNAMGLAAAITLVLLVGLTADLREHVAVRALAAAGAPLVAATAYLTLSRGGVLAGVVGLLALVLLSRAPGLLPALPGLVSTIGLAVLAAASADALTDGYDVASQATLDAGRSLGRQLGVLAAAAAVMRIALLPLDRRLAARPPRPWPVAIRVAAGVAVLAVASAGALAVDAPARLADQWDAFVSSEAVPQTGDQRLLATSANGRIEHWDVALDAFAREPLRGIGAGTYVHEWARERPLTFTVQDAHSLYLETLAELGAIGLLLLCVALAVPFGAALARRHEDRLLWSTVAAAILAWLLRAGIDWDWEVPALTLPVIGLLGAACASDAVTRRRRSVGRLPRVLAGLALLLVAVTPARVVVSQAAMDDALAAFRANDCRRTIDRALTAQSALSMRSEPYELIGYCDVRLGQSALAVRMLAAAVRTDARSWEARYGLALVRAARGTDPRPDLRRALELNPREPVLREVDRSMRGADPAVWRRQAASAPLIVPSREDR